jgi:hypothetical protein
MNFVDYVTLDKKFAYPLRALSIFEVLYVLILVKGVNSFSLRAHKQSRATWWIVSCSYILVFLLWLVFYMVVYK